MIKTMSEMRFRIPENLNIDEVIENNKEIFYRSNLKKGKLIFIMDALINSRAKHRSELNEHDKKFAPLSTEILQEVVYDYKNYLNFLVDTGIWLSDNHFIPGEKCKGYCFNIPYDGQRLKEERIDCYILKKAKRRALDKRNKELKKSMWGYGYLTKWWETDKLKIDLIAVDAWLALYEKENIQLIKDDSKKKKAERIKRAIDTTEDFKQLARNINYHKAHYSFSGDGHRFYTPISNLKRELRNFLTYDGQPLVEVDIKNSQPFLSIKLFDLSFWECSKNNQNLNLKGIDTDIYNKVKNNNCYNDIITLLKTSKSLNHKDSDIEKYTDLVVNGLFYEHIQKHFEPLFPERFNKRSNVKKEVLRIFYVENEDTDKHFYRPCKIFKYHFPLVYELFRLIKEIQGNYLPIILQRIESFLILDVICKKISVLHPHIPLFTIHDSILTTQGNEAIVEDIMAREIQNWTGYKASFGRKELLPMQLAA